MRVGQTVVALNLALAAAGILLFFVRDIEIPSSDVAVLSVFWPLSALSYSVLAFLIISRQPDHVIGWLFLIVGFFTAIIVSASGFPELETSVRSEILRIVVNILGEMAWIAALFIPVTLVLQFYPDGRLPSKRWWPITLATLIAIGSIFVGFIPDIFGTTMSEGISDLLAILSNVLLAPVILGSLAAVVVRYVRSRGTERIQLKWLVYTAVVGILIGMAFYFILGPKSLIPISFFFALPTLIAASVGIAILRYRLFDIEIIIRRTLQYGILTGILVLVYFGMVIIFQSIFVEIGGQQAPIFIVISTLAVAALFNPLRRRVQSVIDRRFYRKKYDAQQVLAQFATVARDEVDQDKLTGELLDVVQQTIHLNRLGITLFMQGERQGEA